MHAPPLQSANADPCAQAPNLSQLQRGKLEKVRDLDESLGHAGGMYAASIRRSTDSTLWVAELTHREPKQAGAILAILRGNVENSTTITLCYTVADEQGQILRSGQLNDCAGCHEAAPHGGIFSETPR